jgi:hypothetical protein
MARKWIVSVLALAGFTVLAFGSTEDVFEGIEEIVEG